MDNSECYKYKCIKNPIYNEHANYWSPKEFLLGKKVGTRAFHMYAFWLLFALGWNFFIRFVYY